MILREAGSRRAERWLAALALLVRSRSFFLCRVVLAISSSSMQEIALRKFAGLNSRYEIDSYGATGGKTAA